MIEQRTTEWLQERCGKVTASRIADVMAKTKSGYGQARINYMADIIAERLTNEPKPSFMTSAMQWGVDTEPQARAMYELQTGKDVVEVGFIKHPEIEWTGASPDGLIDDDGLIEIKCPNTATHISTLLECKIDKKYLLQMHWQMICTQRQWCDFVSFDPRLPPQMQLHVQRVTLDDELAKEVENEIKEFLSQVDEKIEALCAKYVEKI
jgi:putative phage-type endonuclease